MSTDPEISGDAVFGTRRGLFAEGAGRLAGATKSPAVFELRASARESSMAPQDGETLFVRLPLLWGGTSEIDVIAVVFHVRDTSGRPGYIGRGVCVAESGETGIRKALDHVVDALPETWSHFISNECFREAGEPLIVDQGGAGHTLSRRDDSMAPLVLSQPDWPASDGNLTVSALAAAIAWADTTRTVVISSRDRDDAAYRVDTGLVTWMAAQAPARHRTHPPQDAARSGPRIVRNPEPSRHPATRDVGSAASVASTGPAATDAVDAGSRDSSPPGRQEVMKESSAVERRLAAMDAAIADIGRRLDALERRNGMPGRGASRNISGPGPASGDPFRHQRLEQDPGFLGRHRTLLVIIAIASGIALLGALGVALVWRPF